VTRSSLASLAAVLAMAFATCGVMTLRTRTPAAPAVRFAPGARVLLDGHNAYPERGRWGDRLDAVLATGLPVAVEQDLHWVRRPGVGYASVVAHDSDAVQDAPTLEAHFFERVRPLMEAALREGARETWPLLVLNLDFKSNEPEHHAHVLALLRRHAPWLTHTVRTGTPGSVTPLVPGPLLVLTGADSAQRRVFHDDIREGDTLWLFGALPPTPVPGTTREARARHAVRLSPIELIPRHAGNYQRWVNFPWGVVEEGGPRAAEAWTAADSTRLRALVQRAHAQGLWIRFYTLDGFAPEQDRGFTASYNFGSLRAVAPRWRAAVAAGVDFIATDQYGDFAAARRVVPRARP
jgi:hypothetical protein